MCKHSQSDSWEVGAWRAAASTGWTWDGTGHCYVQGCFNAYAFQLRERRCSAAIACFSHQASTSNAGSALGEAKNWENTMRLSLMQELLSVPIRPICKGHAANFLWSSHPHFFLMQNKKRPPLPCHPEDPAWWAASVPAEQCREDPPPLLPPLCPAWGLMLPPGQETRVLPLPDWTLALQTALLL